MAGRSVRYRESGEIGGGAIAVVCPRQMGWENCERLGRKRLEAGPAPSITPHHSPTRHTYLLLQPTTPTVDACSQHRWSSSP